MYSTSSAQLCHSCTPSTETHVSQRSVSHTYASGSVRSRGTSGPGAGWYVGVDQLALGSRTPLEFPDLDLYGGPNPTLARAEGGGNGDAVVVAAPVATAQGV